MNEAPGTSPLPEDARAPWGAPLRPPPSRGRRRRRGGRAVCQGGEAGGQEAQSVTVSLHRRTSSKRNPAPRTPLARRPGDSGDHSSGRTGARPSVPAPPGVPHGRRARRFPRCRSRVSSEKACDSSPFAPERRTQALAHGTSSARARRVTCASGTSLARRAAWAATGGCGW